MRRCCSADDFFTSYSGDPDPAPEGTRHFPPRIPHAIIAITRVLDTAVVGLVALLWSTPGPSSGREIIVQQEVEDTCSADESSECPVDVDDMVLERGTKIFYDDDGMLIGDDLKADF